MGVVPKNHPQVWALCPHLRYPIGWRCAARGFPKFSRASPAEKKYVKAGPVHGKFAARYMAHSPARTCNFSGAAVPVE